MNDIQDIEDLYDAMREDPLLDRFRNGKSPLVPGEGTSVHASALIIGDLPRAQEVMALRPLTGASGKILYQLMSLAGLRSKDAMDHESRILPANTWITNVFKYRLSRSKLPTLEEIDLFKNYLRKEWELIGKPQLIIPVGSVALTAVTNRMSSIENNTGYPFRSPEGNIIWPMLPPYFGVDNPKLQSAIEKQWNHLGKRRKAGLFNARY